jgi:hypothetical protein
MQTQAMSCQGLLERCSQREEKAMQNRYLGFPERFLALFALVLMASGPALAQDPAESACGSNHSIEGVNWAIADDGSDRIYVAGTGGVYRSCDGGDTWTAPDRFSAAPLSLLVDPVDASIIYYGTSGAGVYRSTDYGASFTATGAGLVEGNIFSLTARKDGAILAGAQSGVYLSTDQGDSWQRVPGSPSGGAIYGLLADPDNASIMYATKYEMGVYRTVDATNWTLSSNGTSEWFISDLEFDPENASVLYAIAARGLWRSVDAGSAWSKVDSFRGSDMVFHPLDSALAYRVSRFDGFSLSRDSGTSWTAKNNGWAGAMPKLQTVHVLANGRILVGTEFAGVFVSDDEGETWAQSGPPPEGVDSGTGGGGTTATQQASLSVSIEYLGKGSVPAGKTARFRVTITNNGPDMSADTTASFSWSHQPVVGSRVGHSYTLTGSQGGCSRSVTPDPDCRLGSIANGASVVVEFSGSTEAGVLHWYELRVWAGNFQSESTMLADSAIGSSVSASSTDGGGGGSCSGWSLLLLLTAGMRFCRRPTPSELVTGRSVPRLQAIT